MLEFPTRQQIRQRRSKYESDYGCDRTCDQAEGQSLKGLWGEGILQKARFKGSVDQRHQWDYKEKQQDHAGDQEYLEVTIESPGFFLLESADNSLQRAATAEQIPGSSYAWITIGMTACASTPGVARLGDADAESAHLATSPMFNSPGPRTSCPA